MSVQPPSETDHGVAQVALQPAGRDPTTKGLEDFQAALAAELATEGVARENGAAGSSGAQSFKAALFAELATEGVATESGSEGSRPAQTFQAALAAELATEGVTLPEAGAASRPAQNFQAALAAELATEGVKLPEPATTTTRSVGSQNFEAALAAELATGGVALPGASDGSLGSENAPTAVPAVLAEPAAEGAAPPDDSTEPNGASRDPPGEEPPSEAVPQPDGSFLLELADKSTLRWTRRPDGTWRKPEHKRAGWVGELENKYVMPAVRNGEKNVEKDLRHELQRQWCLWIRRLPAELQHGDMWQNNQRKVHEFATAEDFWCMSHFASPPSKFEGTDYSLFERGVTPAWEDPAFVRGGRWVVKLEKVKAQHLDDLWLSLNMALIGEGFAECCGELVRGATVSLRSRVTKVALWLTRADDEEVVMAIGREYRKVLADTPGTKSLATKDMAFEDFAKQATTLELRRPPFSGATIGLFQ